MPQSGFAPRAADTSQFPATPQNRQPSRLTPVRSHVLREAAERFSAPPAQEVAAYRVGQGDILELRVFQIADLSGPARVRENGAINLPLIGNVSAAGRPVHAIEDDIKRKLAADYLQNPQVTVTIKAFNSQRVTVDGAVHRPGVYTKKSALTLMQAVATAGGLTEMADARIVIFRSAGGTRSAGLFDLGEIRRGIAPDPAIEAGDVVVASSSQFKETLKNVSQILGVGRVFVPFI